MIYTASPLKWPLNQKRTPAESRCASDFQKSKYPITLIDAMGRIEAAFAKIDVPSWAICITMDVKLRSDGIPTAGRMKNRDPGVAVYWPALGTEKQMHVLAIDKYQRLSDNLAAAALMIGAFGYVKQIGGGQVLVRALSGLTHSPSLPPTN